MLFRICGAQGVQKTFLQAVPEIAASLLAHTLGLPTFRRLVDRRIAATRSEKDATTSALRAVDGDKVQARSKLLC